MMMMNAVAAFMALGGTLGTIYYYDRSETFRVAATKLEQPNFTLAAMERNLDKAKAMGALTVLFACSAILF